MKAWLFIPVVWAGASAGTSTDDNFPGNEEQSFFPLSSCASEFRAVTRFSAYGLVLLVTDTRSSWQEESVCCVSQAPGTAPSAAWLLPISSYHSVVVVVARNE